MKEALFYSKMAANKVRCVLCPRFCIIQDGKIGACGVRKNQGGTLYSVVYGKLCSLHIDPIEKKPLFHFAPGTECLSIATVGCNLMCSFCFTPEATVVTDKGVYTLKKLFDEGENEIIKPTGVIRMIDSHKTITHKGNEQIINKIFEHPYVGDIILVKPHYSPEIRCTPSHKMLVSRRPESGKVERIKAEDLKTTDYMVIPKNKQIKKNDVLNVKEVLTSAKKGELKRRNRKLTQLKLKQMLKMSSEGKFSKEIGKTHGFHPVYARRLMSESRKNGESSLFTKKTRIVEVKDRVRIINERGEGIPKRIKVDEKLGKLLGYYCAEGHLTKLKNRPNSNTMVFSFARYEKKQIDETKKLLKEVFGVDAHIFKRRTTTAVEISKASLGILFDSLCGRVAKNKRVPYFLFGAEKNTIKAFLNAYIEGDGWIGNDVVSINTVSRELALGIYRLFLDLNLLPSFYTWKPKPRKLIENRSVKQSTLYYVKLQSKMYRRFLSINSLEYEKPEIERKIFHENEDCFFVPIDSISKEEYTGLVYNLEVEGEHSYLANFVAVCNCQNWEISHPESSERWLDSTSPSRQSQEEILEEMAPEKIIALAKEYKLPGIAYTYTEPTVFFEYALDVMRLAREEGLYNIWVSNGYTNPEPAKKAAKFMDAINVDLKGDGIFYKRLCGIPNEDPIREALKIYKKADVWIEVTTLLIPGYNDSEKTITGIVEWVKNNLGEDTPMHFSRFYPQYKLTDVEPTPVKTIEDAVKIAEKLGMHYVYAGNIYAHDKESTHCPKCGRKVIDRVGYHISKIRNKCPECGTKIAIAGEKWAKL